LLARAIVGGSRYLFLDEPEAGVDSQQIAGFYSLLSKLNADGRTVLLVSHDINVILKTVSSVLCLNRTLHCHTSADLVSAEVVQKTWGDVLRLVDKHF
ncbi:MAG TPA: ABC transporter ATP-binding protein, partial [Spirochaetota bacterium]|nr:ABC transporter ATP-binding protein [Spirochaetota bacterium]